MVDTISKEKRKEIMSKIRGKDTKIEVKVRNWLHKQGLRYRKNCKEIPGTPDISIKKYKIAIFVNGCFWHAHHDCKLFRYPKSNEEYWAKKLAQNVARDRGNIEKLHNLGWNVFVIWECQVEKSFDSTMKNLLDEILKLKSKH